MIDFSLHVAMLCVSFPMCSNHLWWLNGSPSPLRSIHINP